MAISQTIVDAVLARLQAAFPDLAVQYFPDDPSTYYLKHPIGALLISYLGARYGEPFDTALVVQTATPKLSITVTLRQLNGQYGAVAVLARLRTALLGYTPPDCRRKLWAVGEQFLGETAGIWQYAFDVSTETVLVEDAEAESGPLLTHVTTLTSVNRLEAYKAEDGTITQEEHPT